MRHYAYFALFSFSLEKQFAYWCSIHFALNAISLYFVETKLNFLNALVKFKTQTFISDSLLMLD